MDPTGLYLTWETLDRIDMHSQNRVMSNQSQPRGNFFIFKLFDLLCCTGHCRYPPTRTARSDSGPTVETAHCSPVFPCRVFI